MVGASVSLTIYTEGDDCVTPESTVVSHGSGGFEITPYDRRRLPSGMGGCPAVLNTFRHDAELLFDTAGAQTVVIHGRKAITGHPDYDVPIQITVQ